MVKISWFFFNMKWSLLHCVFKFWYQISHFFTIAKIFHALNSLRKVVALHRPGVLLYSSIPLIRRYAVQLQASMLLVKSKTLEQNLNSVVEWFEENNTHSIHIFQFIYICRSWFREIYICSLWLAFFFVNIACFV